MRGSPVIHTLLLIGFIAVSGWIFACVTRPATGVAVKKTLVASAEAKSVRIPYRLTFSSPPREITVAAGPGEEHGAVGTLLIDSENPVVFLKAVWSAPAEAGETRFAKLVMEWPGRETVIHVFDSAGDMDEVFEVPEKLTHD